MTAIDGGGAMRLDRIWFPIIRAGLLTTVLDGIFAGILNTAWHGTFLGEFQLIASTVLGPPAMHEGWRSMLFGLAMHATIAFTWSTVFALLVVRFRGVQSVVARRGGVLLAAVGYGTFIWLVMSFAVIPALVHRPPTLGIHWVELLLGHWFVVGPTILAGTAPLWREESP